MPHPAAAVRKVISIDLDSPVLDRPRDDVYFLGGDANALGAVPTPDRLAALDRPLLVIEDSSHTAETTLVVLNFFAPVLRSGEYIVIEDAVVSDLGRRIGSAAGPGSLYRSSWPRMRNLRSSRRCATNMVTISRATRTAI
jgi:cephalosporin hydroxylase